MATLAVPGQHHLSPIIDEYNLVVTSQSLLQLRFGPVEHCIHWTVSQALNVANAIRKSLTETINQRCDCDFQMNEISTGEFSCQTTKLDAIYRTVIKDTGNSLKVSELVDKIQEWKEEDGTFLVDLMRLRIKPSCPLHIKSLSEEECGVNGGKILDENDDGGAEIDNE